MTGPRPKLTREDMEALGFHVMKNGGIMASEEGPLIWIPGYYEPDVAGARLSFKQTRALSDWIAQHRV